MGKLIFAIGYLITLKRSGKEAATKDIKAFP